MQFTRSKTSSPDALAVFGKVVLGELRTISDGMNEYAGNPARVRMSIKLNSLAAVADFVGFAGGRALLSEMVLMARCIEASVEIKQGSGAGSQAAADALRSQVLARARAIHDGLAALGNVAKQIYFGFPSNYLLMASAYANLRNLSDVDGISLYSPGFPSIDYKAKWPAVGDRDQQQFTESVGEVAKEVALLLVAHSNGSPVTLDVLRNTLRDVINANPYRELEPLLELSFLIAPSVQGILDAQVYTQFLQMVAIWANDSNVLSGLISVEAISSAIAILDELVDRAHMGSDGINQFKAEIDEACRLFGRHGRQKASPSLYKSYRDATERLNDYWVKQSGPSNVKVVAKAIRSLLPSVGELNNSMYAELLACLSAATDENATLGHSSYEFWVNGAIIVLLMNASLENLQMTESAAEIQVAQQAMRNLQTDAAIHEHLYPSDYLSAESRKSAISSVFKRVSFTIGDIERLITTVILRAVEMRVQADPVAVAADTGRKIYELISEVLGVLKFLNLHEATRMAQRVADLAVNPKAWDETDESRELHAAVSALAIYSARVRPGDLVDMPPVLVPAEAITVDDVAPPLTNESADEEDTNTAQQIHSDDIDFLIDCPSDSDLFDLFVSEVSVAIPAAKNELSNIANSGLVLEHLLNVRRCFHTIKGSGLTAGVANIAGVAESAQFALDAWTRIEPPRGPDFDAMVNFSDSALEWLDKWISEASLTGFSKIPATEIDEIKGRARIVSQRAEELGDSQADARSEQTDDGSTGTVDQTIFDVALAPGGNVVPFMRRDLSADADKPQETVYATAQSDQTEDSKKSVEVVPTSSCIDASDDRPVAGRDADNYAESVVSIAVDSGNEDSSVTVEVASTSANIEVSDEQRDVYDDADSHPEIADSHPEMDVSIAPGADTEVSSVTAEITPTSGSIGLATEVALNVGEDANGVDSEIGTIGDNELTIRAGIEESELVLTLGEPLPHPIDADSNDSKQSTIEQDDAVDLLSADFSGKMDRLITTDELLSNLRSGGESLSDTYEIENPLIPVVLSEANSSLSTIEDCMRSLENGSDVDDPIGSMSHAVHGLKGALRTAGLMRSGEILHVLEDDLGNVCVADMDKLRIQVYQHAFDLVGAAISQLEQDLASNTSANAKVPVQVASVRAANVTALIAPISEASATRFTPTVDTGVGYPFPSRAAKGTSSRQKNVPMVPVPTMLLERLGQRSGESVVLQSRALDEIDSIWRALRGMGASVDRLVNVLKSLHLEAELRIDAGTRQAGIGSDFDALELDRFTGLQETVRSISEIAEDIRAGEKSVSNSLLALEETERRKGVLSAELQKEASNLMVVRFSSKFTKMQQTVRLASAETRKSVTLSMEGDADVSGGVMTKLAPAIDHILRNCVAHGIESPNDRRAAKKPATGRINVHVWANTERTAITISDDGAGIDTHAVLAKARERGLASDRNYTDQEIYDFLFLKGFSTAKEVSQLAGRGVGLDAVKAALQEFGGEVYIHSTMGKGTEFRIEAPNDVTSLSVVPISAGGQTCMVPSSFVDRIIPLSAKDAQEATIAGAIKIDGMAFKYCRMGWLLSDQPQLQRQATVQLLLCGLDTPTPTAFEVDDIAPYRKVLVRRLGRHISRIPGLIAGATLADGAVSLIVNPLRMSHRHQFGVEKVAGPAVPLVMIVDDSPTVRLFTRKFLTKHGYEVVEAGDGIEALEVLRTTTPDAFLLDVEMPRMSGFELLTGLRQDSRFDNTPKVMVTSRTAQKHRDHAAKLGVSDYIGKPFEEDVMLRILGKCFPGHISLVASA